MRSQSWISTQETWVDGMLLGKESSSPFCESWLGSAAAVFLHVWLVDMVLEWWQQLRQSQNKADARQSMQNGGRGSVLMIPLSC